MPYRLISALVLAGVGSQALALDWDHATEERTVERGTPSLELTYHFRNKGRKAVRIESVETSCRCTTATFAKSEFAPGEEGDMSVAINLVGRTEGEEKTITVLASDSPLPAVLTLRVNLSAPWEVSPHLLSWRQGDRPVEREATIILDAARRVSVRIASSDRSKISARLRASEDGSGQTLTVMPLSTDRQFVTPIELDFDSPVTGRQSLLIYAQVR